MKKILYIALGFLIITLAMTTVRATSPCQNYMDLAGQKMAPPYPNYFGAGEEYYQAAQCYQQSGMQEKAFEAFEKAAKRYEKASGELVKDGDHEKAALSYRKAGKAYEILGDKGEAIRTYKKSKERYETGGYNQKAKIMEQRISALKQVSQEPLKNITGASTRSLVGLVSLIALFVSVAFLGAILVANMIPENPSDSKHGKKGGPSNKPSGPSSSSLGSSDLSRPNQDKELESENQMENKDTGKSLSARERKIKKLKDKYGR